MWKKILGGLILVVILAFVLVLWLTSGMTEATDEFFSLLKQDKVEEAYEMTSEEFQASTSQEEFKSFLSKTSLGEFQSADWNSRQRGSGGEGTLEGTVHTTSGGNIPITVKLIKENEEWKILNLQKADAGIEEKGTSSKKTVPEQEELKGLVHDTMLLAAESIESEDFSSFYGSVAELWRGQSSEEEFQKMMTNNFQSFIENKNIDLAAIEEKDPVFDQDPKINENGLLVVNGYYSIQPAPVYFQLQYTYEDTTWKLVGINMEVR